MGSKPSAPDDYGLIELAENRKYAQKYPEWAFECGLTEYQARHSDV